MEDAAIGRLDTPAKTRVRPIAFLIAGGTALIALIAIGTAILVANFRERALVDRERELSNTALILAEQSDRALQSFELIQKSVIERMQAVGIASAEDYRREMSGRDVHLALRDKISGLPHVEAVVLFDAKGNLINFSRFWPIPALNIAHRDYF